jgi:hypothetical protein
MEGFVAGPEIFDNQAVVVVLKECDKVESPAGCSTWESVGVEKPCLEVAIHVKEKFESSGADGEFGLGRMGCDGGMMEYLVEVAPWFEGGGEKVAW